MSQHTIIKAKEIRKSMLEKRAKLQENLDIFIHYSNLAQENILNSEIWNKSKDIALYLPFRSEVLTHQLIENAYAQKKNLYFPRCCTLSDEKNKGKMDFVQISQNEYETSFESGAYGILEPKKDLQGIELPEQSLVILPCLAYNKDGYRLGYGGGYYDRLLEINKNYTKDKAYYIPLVLAFKFQESAEFTNNIWDMPALYIANEKEIVCTI